MKVLFLNNPFFSLRSISMKSAPLKTYNSIFVSGKTVDYLHFYHVPILGLLVALWATLAHPVCPVDRIFQCLFTVG